MQMDSKILSLARYSKIDLPEHRLGTTHFFGLVLRTDSGSVRFDYRKLNFDHSDTDFMGGVSVDHRLLNEQFGGFSMVSGWAEIKSRFAAQFLSDNLG
jgi:hypothetical protein